MIWLNTLYCYSLGTFSFSKTGTVHNKTGTVRLKTAVWHFLYKNMYNDARRPTKKKKSMPPEKKLLLNIYWPFNNDRDQWCRLNVLLFVSWLFAWLFFFLSMKKNESKKSINFEKKYHQDMLSATRLYRGQQNCLASIREGVNKNKSTF